MLTRRCAHAFLLGLALATPSLPPHARKLNAPLPRASLGDVVEFQLVPGQARVLYRADADTDGVVELWSRGFEPLEPARRVFRELGLGQDVTPGVHVDPSGRRVLFSVSSTSPPFWSAPLDGSAEAVQFPGFERFSPDGLRVVFPNRRTSTGRIDMLLGLATDGSTLDGILCGSADPSRDILDYQISADSMRVAFVGDQTVDERFELYSVPIDGSAPPIRLQGSPQRDCDVTDFRLTPDGRTAVYRADHERDGKFELFRVPLDGSEARVRVTPDMPNDSDIEREFQLSPDGARVVFLSDRETPGVPELFASELGLAPAAIRVSPPLAPGGTVRGDFQLAPDGARVVYRADPEGDGAFELYGARLDGLTPPRVLCAPAPGQTLGRSEISADSSRTVFLLAGAALELWSAPLDGSTPAQPVHPPLVAGGDVVRFELAGARAVYRADQDVDERLELFSAPLDASTPPVRLHPPLAAGRAVLPDFRVAADGRTVAFLADLAGDERFELFVAPSDGSAPPLRASDPLATAPTPVGDVRAMAPAGAFVVYSADQERDEVVELYSAPRDGRRGPRRLHAPAVADGDVGSFVVTSDGTRVVFDGDLETDGQSELYAAPADGSAPAVKLNGPLAAGGEVTAWRASPDGRSVAFAAGTSPGRSELYAVALDDSAPPVPLDPPPHRTFGSVGALELTADGRSVVYTSDNARRGRFELYSVPLDGGAPPVRLSAVTALGGDVLDFRIGGDSRWVVYRADQDTDDLPDIYGAPLDGSAPPVRLNVPLSGNQRVWDYALAAGNRVVYTAGLAFLRELSSVPVDGSAPPRRFLSGLEQSFDFWLTPAGTRVLFRSQFHLQVFCAPSDASSAPVRLDGPIYRTRFFEPLFLDEDTVLYFAGTTGRPPGTYRTRLDGSVPPVLVDAHGAPHVLSSDRRLALVHGSLGELQNDGLYVLPVDGSAPARRASQRLPPGASVFAAAFADGGDVLYIADEERLGARELYASGAAFAPALGGGPDGSAAQPR